MVARLKDVLVALLTSFLVLVGGGESVADRPHRVRHREPTQKPVAGPTVSRPQAEIPVTTADATNAVSSAPSPGVETATPTGITVPSDNGDKRRNGQTTDTDGDGVSDELERRGYTYDSLSGHFKIWDREREPNARHWFTDPLQWSTDQDAYSDGMEASGATMDVAVRAPGNDPLVPAYPNIVVQLASYAVTLNEEITYDEGGSLAKGTNWNRETAQTSSRGEEHHWEVGGEVEYKFGPTGGWSGKLSVSGGGSYSNTQTSSHAVSVGGSVLDESNWSRARTTNPTDAARIKLRLKVHNHGTACASNVNPTLTLRIGGINVATFEPGNAQVNLLVPGGVYPPEPGVYWVVDSIDTGVGISPLSLTMDELRALERGAPISLSVTQLKADVMLADRAKGWSSAGDINEYLARCDAVCANVRVEVADGSFVHHLVFADDAPSGPRASMRDALRRIGLRGDGLLPYTDSQGATRMTNLAGYSFIFDQQTLIDNKWNFALSPAVPPDRFVITDTVLGPETSVYVKAPREVSDTGPTIHYANADSQNRKLTLCASDYQGIKTVTCLNKDGVLLDDDGRELALVEDITGSGFFQAVIPDGDYVFDGSERVVVTNVAGQSAERSVHVIYYKKPRPLEKPRITDVAVDWTSNPPRVYATVTNPNDPEKYKLQWVRVYLKQRKAFVKMDIAEEEYKIPDRWRADLKDLQAAGSEELVGEELMVVAYIGPEIYTEIPIGRQIVRTGIARLGPRADWSGKNAWVKAGVDFDTGEVETSGIMKSFPQPYGPPIDVTVSAHTENFRLSFGDRPWYAQKVAFEAVNERFDAVDEDEIRRRLSEQNVAKDFIFRNENEAESVVFVTTTNAGNLVKFVIRVEALHASKWKRNAVLDIRYVTYEENRKATAAMSN